MRSAAVAVALCAFSVTAAGEIQLTPAGEFRGMDGRPSDVPAWKIDATIAARVIAAAARQDTRFVVDYEHQTLLAQENGQPAPAAGWWSGASMQWREGQGLFAPVEWTERAKQMIAAGEYKYISPVFAYNTKTGEVVRMICAALTNTPNLDGMAEVTNRVAARFSFEGTDNMERTILAALIAALGLPEATSEKDALAGVAALKLKADKVPELETKLTASETQLAAAKQNVVDPGKFVSIDKYNTVVADVAALKQKLDERDLAEVVDLAMGEGRLASNEEDWAKKFAKDHGIAALKESLAKRAPIPALQRQQSKQKDRDENKGELTEAQLAVCKQLGVKPEDYKKQLAPAASA